MHPASVKRLLRPRRRALLERRQPANQKGAADRGSNEEHQTEDSKRFHVRHG
jgi:hypothetical protein